MKNKEALNLNLISKYRNELFGISIISIMAFHFFYNVVNCAPKSGVVYSMARVYDNAIGPVGVEIFLFLSGMGLYFSLKKNSGIGQFYKRRMTRVLLPYAIWGGLYWIGSDVIAGEHSAINALLDFSFVTFFTKGERALWYIGFIIVMYLVFPFIFKAFESEKRGFLYFCILLVLSVALAVGLKLAFPSFYKNIEVAVSRIPIFLIGSYMGKRIYKNEDFKPLDFAAAALGIAVRLFGILQRYDVLHTSISFMRYESALFAISLIYLCVWVLKSVRLEGLKRFLRGAGALSLELYMTHVTIDNALDYCGFLTYKAEIYILIILMSIISSILLHFAVKKIIIYITDKTGKMSVRKTQ